MEESYDNKVKNYDGMVKKLKGHSVSPEVKKELTTKVMEMVTPIFIEWDKIPMCNPFSKFRF